MNRIADRCRDNVGRSAVRSLRPAVEGLEDRRLLSTVNGGQWYYPDRITYSFVPDGTTIAGVTSGPATSNLFATLNAITTTANWQLQFQKAAAIWQQFAGFNIVQVSDSGDPIGTSGFQQGDSRFGDIRIGGTAMSSSLLAASFLPPPLNGGTDAGDIIVNTSQAWKINNDYDLLTVAIHELGHSLGMGHSAIAAASMYTYYTSMKQSLDADDKSGMQGLYGAPPADPTANTTAATAIDLTSLLDPQGRMSYDAGRVTSTSNFEWYKITVPSTTTGTMTVSMQSTDLSSLSPRLLILNSSQVALGQAIATNVYGTTVSIAVGGVTPGQVYYIRASSAQNGPGMNGAFGLLVNFGTSPQSPIAPPYTTVASSSDLVTVKYMGETIPTKSRHQQRLQHLHPQLGHDHDHDHGVHPFVVKLANRRALAEQKLTREVRHPRPARFRLG